MSSLSNNLVNALGPLFEEAWRVVGLIEYGGSAAIPHAWMIGSEESEAMKRLWAGALIKMVNENGEYYVHVPSSGSIVRFKDDELQLRVVVDGTDSGSWFKESELAILSFWSGAMLPVGDIRRLISPNLGGDPILFKPVQKEEDASDGMAHLSGAIAGGEPIVKTVAEWAEAAGHPVGEWRPFEGANKVAPKIAIAEGLTEYVDLDAVRGGEECGWSPDTSNMLKHMNGDKFKINDAPGIASLLINLVEASESGYWANYEQDQLVRRSVAVCINATATTYVPGDTEDASTAHKHASAVGIKLLRVLGTYLERVRPVMFNVIQ